MIERIGLTNFLEGVGVDIDPNMIEHPRTNPYVRTDGWDEEAEKWFVASTPGTRSGGSHLPAEIGQRAGSRRAPVGHKYP